MRASGTPKQPRVFYGWVIVAALAISGGWSLAMASATFGLFVEPMRDALGFDQSIFGWTNTARMLGGSLSLVFIGRLLDRYGPRVLFGVAGTAACLLIISVGHISTEWHLVAIFAGLGVLGMQGNAAAYTAPPVAKWFVRRRATAMGMLAAGPPIALVGAFPFTQWLIGRYGWPTAWLGLGLGGLAFITVPALVLLRRQPEDMGLLPDGDPPGDGRVRAREATADQGVGADDSEVIVQEYQWTRAEALRSAVFWRLTLAFSLVMFNLGSINIFRFPHFVQRGVDPSIVAYAASSEAAVSLVLALTMGMVVARFGLLRSTAAFYLLMAAGTAVTIIAGNSGQVFAAAIMWGTGLGAVSILLNTLYPAYFGRQHMGAIRGVALSVVQLAAAASGPLTGYVADLTGSYAPVWWPTVAMLIVGAALVTTLGSPKAPARVVGEVS